MSTIEFQTGNFSCIASNAYDAYESRIVKASHESQGISQYAVWQLVFVVCQPNEQLSLRASCLRIIP